MTDTLLWTFEDYERFVQHDDYFARSWAVYRIQDQYPERAAEAFVSLLTDWDTYHRIVAAETLGKTGDTRYEPALLDVLSEPEDLVRRRIIVALGQLRSETLRPELIRELDAAEVEPARGYGDPRSAAATALGHYPDAEARAALWRFVERYPLDDQLADDAFEGILRFPEVDAVPRLVRRYRELTPTRSWAGALSAFADAAGVRRLVEELTSEVKKRQVTVWETLEAWLGQSLMASVDFEEAFEAAAERDYAGLLPRIAAEIRHVAQEQEDDVDAWRAAWAAGEVPTGYRWRMTYSEMLVSALAENASRGRERYLDEVSLGLALLGQILTDYDDEGALEAASDAEARRKVLLGILGSPRQNVMPDVVDQVAALGPAVVPDLVGVLRGVRYWGCERALNALEHIARAHPGAADAAVPAILDLIDEFQGDFVLEAAEEALRAIGPGAVEEAAAWLGRVDYVYDIYVTGAIGEIPTETSVDVLLDHIDDKGMLEEMDVEGLASLGHRRVMPLLRSIYQPGDPLVARALYTVGVVNGYTGPGMREWRAIAQEQQDQIARIFADSRDEEEGFISERPGPPETDTEQSGRRRRRRKKSERKEPKKKDKKKRKRRRKRR
ncbi:MAG: hypothetical protein MAG451_01670 [Anaerolineales bacterium]|nr:hypothetical protein [Anaerolineales bacterium]